MGLAHLAKEYIAEEENQQLDAGEATPRVSKLAMNQMLADR